MKAMLASGGTLPRKGIFLSLRGEEKHAALLASLPDLQVLDVPLYATAETWQFLHEQQIAATLLHEEDGEVEDAFRQQRIDLAVVIVAGRLQRDFDQNYVLRRLAIDCNIHLITKIKQMRIFLHALASKELAGLPIKAWDEYQHNQPTEELIISPETLLSTQV
ncbi:hypothetical protein [Dictyobacter kobayashii]|uniref:MGS-like domain-containing protein n=1 Tax=Dictyobacter kobayashii TaxID=2014872 RepID=A0A402AFB7_9CHLR|nr:hypothetical protein [Dictyobacter kobayashii]GCE17775.1 hypothetical protein KDK_15750 [Dictyobacter kobayashii]